MENQEVFNDQPITKITASLCKALDIDSPYYARQCLPQLDEFIATAFGNKKVDKMLLYNPDAIAQWVLDKYPKIFAPIVDNSQLRINMLSVYPPKTPVCFASLYSGATPAEHTIQSYEKKRLTIDTFFDALARAGKKVCIITIKNQSMDILFRGRNIDYYSLKNDKQVIQTALTKISENVYDIICVYNQKYDDAIHLTYPKSFVAKRALKNYAKSYAQLVEAVKNYWTNDNVLTACLTDHGVHREWHLRGSHGKNIAQDMNIAHFYNAFKGQGQQ